MWAHGPRRRIVGEELTRPDGETLFELYEVLSCGHRQPLQEGPDGLPNASERCCKGCRDELPVGPVGEVSEECSVRWE